MSVEQFCLKWNNFQTNILAAFENLQYTEDLTDVTLTCEGFCLKAHKFILSACSPYFRRLFKENPCPHPIVILTNVSYKDLCAILNFMYRGEVMILKDQLQSFLDTAEILQVSGLKSLPEIWQNKRGLNEQQQPLETSNKKKKSLKEKTEFEKIKIKEETNCDEFHAEETQIQMQVGSILERSLTAVTMPTIPSPKTDEMIKIEKENETEIEDIDETPVVSDVPHHSSHSGICPHCGEVYSNQSALKYHVRLVHSDLLNMYCCHLCPQSFNYREGYRNHMTDVHCIRP